MEIVWLLILCYGALVIGYCLGRQKARTLQADVPRPDTREPLRRLAWNCHWIIARRLDDKRPVAWWLKRKWPLLPRGRQGDVYLKGVVVRVFEDVNIDSIDLSQGDPAGKLEAAANKIADRLHAMNIAAFVDMQLPGGLDFASRTVDVESNVVTRLVRGFDISTNCFLTILECLVVEL